MSTETRIQALAIWKSGMSSLADMSHGSGAFVFTHANQEYASSNHPNVFLNPRVLVRTSNYSFPGDEYGRIKNRSTASRWRFEDMCGFKNPCNELLIKHAVSVLDDFEVVVFENPAHRDVAIEALHQLGITEIRGLPIAQRIVADDSYAIKTALTAARQAMLKC
jgi:hypothetical protein